MTHRDLPLNIYLLHSTAEGSLGHKKDIGVMTSCTSMRPKDHVKKYNGTASFNSSLFVRSLCVALLVIGRNPSFFHFFFVERGMGREECAAAMSGGLSIPLTWMDGFIDSGGGGEGFRGLLLGV